MSFGNLRGVWILAMVCLLTATACSNSNTFNLSTDVEDLTAEQIFQKGEYELSRKRYKEGAVFFSEIERLYPYSCLLYTSPSPRDRSLSRMPSSA